MSQVIEPEMGWNIRGDSFPAYTKAYEEYEENANRTKADTKTRTTKVKLLDIQDAHNRIRNAIVFTPLIEAKYIGKTKYNIFLKCENLQYTGSFKARGACNILSSMSPAAKARGCTISGGRNFLLAMSHYGLRESVSINIVIPNHCPLSELQRYKENQAVVKCYGNDVNDARLHALTCSDDVGSNYIHGTDRFDLIAGYGTLGLELLVQVEKIDAVLCPVGSGGLVASLILAIKSLKPGCLIYGVECAAASTMTKALEEKKPVMVQIDPTIADSLAHVIAGKNSFNILKQSLDRMITVDEEWIARAMISLLQREKMVVEGAAACPIAAIMAGKCPELQGKNVVCIITGGNISNSTLSRVIDRGMAAEGQLVKFYVSLHDVPGAMAQLLTKVSNLGANVKGVEPDHDWMRQDVGIVSVKLLIETCDMHHAKELEKALIKDYPHSHFMML